MGNICFCSDLVEFSSYDIVLLYKLLILKLNGKINRAANGDKYTSLKLYKGLGLVVVKTILQSNM